MQNRLKMLSTIGGHFTQSFEPKFSSFRAAEPVYISPASLFPHITGYHVNRWDIVWAGLDIIGHRLNNTFPPREIETSRWEAVEMAAPPSLNSDLISTSSLNIVWSRLTPQSIIWAHLHEISRRYIGKRWATEIQLPSNTPVLHFLVNLDTDGLCNRLNSIEQIKRKNHSYRWNIMNHVQTIDIITDHIVGGGGDVPPKPGLAFGPENEELPKTFLQ